MSNKEIINYIENVLNLDINDANNEVGNLLNLIENNTCSTFVPANNNFAVNGIGGEDNVTDSTNYTFLIPNLFRLCYVQDTLLIPNICNLFIFYNKTLNFIPILIDEKLIKSFLYFNFPVNISNNEKLNKYVNDVKGKYDFLVNKKRLSTYGSFSTSVNIFSQLYSVDSMLFQLLSLYKYIGETNNANSSSLNLCGFNVIWDFTSGCNCTTIDLNDTYILGNFNYDFYLSQSNGLNIYKINNELQKNPNTQNFDTIFTVLRYAKDVFEDILLEIQYFMDNGLYCRKDYMLESNIPHLLELYTKFYNNQLESISKQQPNVRAYDVSGSRYNISLYIIVFINIYNKTNKNYYLTKSILLDGEDGNDAIVIFSNINFKTTTNAPAGTINYYYYYLNINIPSPVEMINSNSDQVSTYTVVKDYTNVYNTSYSSSTETTYNIVKEYPYDGLYPNGGDSTDLNNLGIKYAFFSSSNVIKYLIYETLETYVLPDNGGKGVSLIYYENYYV
jgi:hypothetical protein